MAIQIDWNPTGRFDAGFYTILEMVEESWDMSDPWFSGMEWLFSLAEVYYCATGEELPEYHKPIAMESWGDLDPDNWNTLELVSLFFHEQIGIKDVEDAFTYLSQIDSTLRTLGYNY